MDYKKTNAPLNTVTRDLVDLSEETGNIYETVCIIAKRSNQIADEMKHDLEKSFRNSLRSTTIWKRFQKIANR